jgi:dihydrofolate reductase
VSKVLIDVSMSLDGLVAGPNDGHAHPLGERGGAHILDGYFSGRTYEIANGWNGTHPVNNIPIVILTHTPPANPPKGRSQARLVDELYLHIAPIILGAGVRLFDRLGDREIRLRKLSSLDADNASHVRFEVLR